MKDTFTSLIAGAVAAMAKGFGLVIGIFLATLFLKLFGVHFRILS